MNDSSDALAELLTLTLTVDQWGNRIYRNSHGQLHRQHGPAIEWADGTRRWYLNGEYLTEREFHERIKRRGG